MAAVIAALNIAGWGIFVLGGMAGTLIAASFLYLIAAQNLVGAGRDSPGLP